VPYSFDWQITGLFDASLEKKWFVSGECLQSAFKKEIHPLF
jgi:hypothetical protein